MHDVAYSEPYIRPEGEPVFEFRNVHYNYPDGFEALHNLSFRLYKGDRLAVVGKNGAGKTTLAKLIAGIIKPTRGEITASNSLRIGMVFQDPDDQLFCPTIFEDMAFGLLLKSLSMEVVEEQVIDWARRLQIENLLRKEPHHLSYGQRKRAVLATVLAMSPDILILDEPTVGLDPDSEAVILDILTNFKGTIVCISHDLFFLYSLCHRALVLKEGRVHHDYTMAQLISEKGTLREHGLDFTFRFKCCSDSDDQSHSPVKKRPHGNFPSKPLIDLRRYSYRYPDKTIALKEIDLTITKGERVALIGGNGAGKSTLALCLAGALKGSGSYSFNGRDVSEAVRKNLWQHVGLVFQNSTDQFFTSSCFQEIAFGLRNLGLTEKEIRFRVQWALDVVRLAGYENRVPHHLSGGEQKRLALATVLALKPDVLILDEPTNNLDPEGERILIEILDEVESTLIIISHDVCFLSFLCDRAVILEKGHIEADMSFEDFLTDQQEAIRHHHEHEYRRRCCHTIRELFYS